MRILAGLDVGSHTINAVAGYMTEEGRLELVGHGSVASRGIRAGAVVHLEAASDAMETVLHQVENDCGFPLEQIAMGLGDDSVRSFNGRGVVPVMGKDREVSAADKQKAFQAAQAMGIPSDREVIHMIQQEYILDGQSGIREPEGMWGERLEAQAHIVTGLVSVVRNFQKALGRIHYKADRIILAPLAIARAVLHPDEEHWGVAVIDLGAQTTGITIIHEDTLKDTAILGVGCDRITHDLAVGLRTPLAEAEMVKCRWGLASGSSTGRDEPEITAMGGNGSRNVAPSLLTSIVGPRVEEILGLVVRKIQYTMPLSRLQGGLVLTGGGANLIGLSQHAQRILQVPVRIGHPTGLGNLPPEGLNPSWSCAVGLLMEMAAEGNPEEQSGKKQLINKVTRPIKEFVKARLAL
ncbi:MAG: cell division protein FtsA [Candidatus Eisenbacteria bacterium]|uniref:Cell division protein FtsA n=1 Tax=Eiseniibacteriota bacterium TaxID=2212470 RepID=A0A948W563_UNCEI|nr:cell division protein FtsA [Candidatus Eisenbacteria bacterium]MBU1947538.1 cell division protein FtsA [Candidatus Eisenbacteria bacterium]MBU2692962.1 cell division protein FtsA [Candidatus Eisenbacteria bacterium]